jgi:eukaryotic-like serine/threonine-protein kinase
MADLKFLAEEWPIISRRLDEALSIAPRERDTWLDSLHETDSIKAKLRNLLSDAVGVETDDFLGSLPKLTLGVDEKSVDSGAQGAATGALIGPYRLIRELGVGGMGAVWLAERIDGGLKRQVALKLPRMTWSRGLAERMSRERDILASLDHPNIARIYDAGLDEHGRPYLALEYVEGEPINVYCKKHALSIRARLLLVLQVSRAVAHAHARLVVHRDLKPANILVNADGQVRLLDFGIAKLMEGQLTQETQLTQQSGRALTLDYASPEQIRGEPIGTASDVYSLGIVAYELLTEAKPYQLKRQSAAALEEAIASVDVRLASAASSNIIFSKDLKGDLDAILNKALKKNVVERYPSVDAFAQDIERHLANLPVQAQPDRWGYRAAKFLRRRRLPVALASAAAIVLLVSASFALWQAHIASGERDRALTLLSRNNAITEFLQMFVTDAAQANQRVNVGDMLERSEIIAEKQFRDAPEDRAVVLAVLSAHRRTLSEFDKAEALIKRAIDSARDSTDTSLKSLLACQYADIIGSLGRIDEARRSLSIAANRADIDAQTAAQCFGFLARISTNINDGPGAVNSAQKALAHLRTLKQYSKVALAGYTGDLAYGLHLSGRNEDASREFAVSIQMFAELGRDTDPVAISVRNNWGIVSIGAGDMKTAIDQYDAIIKLLNQVGNTQPPTYVLSNRARALELAGRFSDAKSAYGVALTVAQKAGNLSFEAYCLIGLASTAREQGDLLTAQKYLKQLDLMDGTAFPKSGPISRGQHNLRGRIALSNGNLKIARDEFTSVLEDKQPNRSTTTALIGRAEVALLENQLEAGLVDIQDALRLSKSMQGGIPFSENTGRALIVEGELRARTGNANEAQAVFASAVEQLTHTVDASHPALKRAQILAAGSAPISLKQVFNSICANVFSLRKAPLSA